MYNFSFFFSCVGSRASTCRGAFGGRARAANAFGGTTTVVTDSALD